MLGVAPQRIVLDIRLIYQFRESADNVNLNTVPGG